MVVFNFRKIWQLHRSIFFIVFIVYERAGLCVVCGGAGSKYFPFLWSAIEHGQFMQHDVESQQFPSLSFPPALLSFSKLNLFLQNKYYVPFRLSPSEPELYCTVWSLRTEQQIWHYDIVTLVDHVLVPTDLCGGES